ncbi:LysR family transcriptional regulator [Amycolatopsis sp. Hca4]|uniref:LysR family transcriptional regulator n=1 Tax=Amycolatopsis sp. Hca4 TaxID=2742131 RepID=UPI0015900181|nr:LysR family transcriptional regulator [Amycolatopsis sp. Hca4]QKV80082.1 LysR family transcriptional regulator [Amycolatopsis sp. Hca4]
MQLDLNLLTVLDALLEEGSVMGAAERLHLSSPAVSRTLGRLRAVTGDDILVRTGHTMVPTPYAVAVREDVHRLVRQARAVLQPARELNLAELDRTFTIQCHDALAASVIPVLAVRLQDRAPGVRLRVLAEHSADTDDLRHGRVDVELGGARPQQPEFRAEVLGRDHLEVAMRRGHPAAGGLDLRTFAEHPHVLVSRRGRLTAPIDEALAAEGLRRRVIASVATLATALQLAERSNALVTCAAVLGRPLIDAFGLITRPLPAKAEAAEICATWHQRFDSDPAHAWLREQIREALEEIIAGH